MKNNTQKIKLLNTIIIAFLLMLNFSFAGLKVEAATSSTCAKLTTLEKQRDCYAAQAAEAKKLADQKKVEASKVAQQITVVEQNISQTETALSATETEVGSTQSQIDDLLAKIKTEEENLAKEKEKMGNILASWYMEGEQGLFEAVLSSDSLSELITSQQYYEAIQQQVNSSIEKINSLKEELKVKKEEQDKKLRDLNDLEASQTEQKNYLASQASYKQKLLTNATSAIAQYTEEEQKALGRENEIEAQIIALISSRRGDWGAERGKGQIVAPGSLIGRMGSTGNSTGAHLHFEVRNPSDQTSNPRNFLGSKYVWPTLSTRVTQEYGPATCTVCGYSFHTGLDIGAQSQGVQGDPIFAAGTGEIVLKQWYGGYGYAVVILHDDDYITLYGHLMSVN